jgi:hypothetical protein
VQIAYRFINIFVRSSAGDSVDGKLAVNSSKNNSDEGAASEDKCVEKVSSLITLVETPDVPLCDILEECRICENGRNDSCQSGICGFYRVTRLVKLSSCVDGTPTSASTVQESSSETSNSQLPSEEIAVDQQTSHVPEEAQQSVSAVPEVTVGLPFPADVSIIPAEDATSSNVAKPMEAVSELTNQIDNKVDHNKNSAKDAVPPESTAFVLKIKTVSEDLKLADEQEAAVVPPARMTADDNSGSTSLSNSAAAGAHKVIHADSSTKLAVPVYDLEPLDDISYQKLARPGKETLYGKLKNRIRSLEVNLNLTNRFVLPFFQFRFMVESCVCWTSVSTFFSVKSDTG